MIASRPVATAVATPAAAAYQGRPRSVVTAATWVSSTSTSATTPNGPTSGLRMIDSAVSASR